MVFYSQNTGLFKLFRIVYPEQRMTVTDYSAIWEAFLKKIKLFNAQTNS